MVGRRRGAGRLGWLEFAWVGGYGRRRIPVHVSGHGNGRDEGSEIEKLWDT